MSLTVSPDQLAANRANATNSTGPRTPEGKLRSSQNARKHGFTATGFAVVRLEDLNEVANLREDLISLYHPVNSQELFAVERIALAQQAILRAARLEAGFLSNCLSEAFGTNGQPRFPMKPQLTADIEICQAQNDNYLLGDGFYRLISHNNSFALLLRYQAQAERQYRRAIQEFDRLKALREELPNEIAWPGNLATPGDENSPLQRHRTFNNLRVFSEEPNSAENETNESTCPPCETNPIRSENPAPAPDPPASVPELNPERDGDPRFLEGPPPKPRPSEGALPPILGRG
jgi:hypothetical protein